MVKNIKKISVLILLLAVFVLTPSLVSAHQPRITDSTEITVVDPEISKAYYGQLSGDFDLYTINSEQPFDFYVNILVPDIIDQKTDLFALIVKDKKDQEPFAFLNGVDFEWQKFHEPFGNDDYLMGPEYKVQAEAGDYDIYVWSNDNTNKYALAIGEKENFDFKEIVNAITLIPKIKKNFFNESPVNFIFSPFGWGYILIMFAFAFIVGFIYRLIIRKLAKNSNRRVGKNINKKDRLIRLALAVILLLVAILTNWCAILIFFAGFCLFEAIFSWCGLYVALGKNTCPV
ncbi:MAG: DUF2892 domain-containing protein [Patescibacteria group bacterium]